MWYMNRQQRDIVTKLENVKNGQIPENMKSSGKARKP